MSLKIEDWRTGDDYHAERITFDGKHIGDVVYNRVAKAWEAWVNYPYGPITEHADSILAIRALRKDAA